MVEEVKITFTEADCARFMAQINWMMGLLNGMGITVPKPFMERLKPLAQAAGLEFVTVDRDTGERDDA